MPAKGRLPQHHEARLLQVLHYPLGSYPRHVLVGLVYALSDPSAAAQALDKRGVVQIVEPGCGIL
jgi:hypothetical protein